MSHYEYPLNLLQQLQELYSSIRKLVARNSDLITITKDAPFNLVVEGKSPNLYFKFLSANLLSENNAQIKIEYCPLDQVYNHKNAALLLVTFALSAFERWINLLKEYEKITLSPYRQIFGICPTSSQTGGKDNRK